MAYYVLGGKMDKQDALATLRTMRYYSPDLKLRTWMMEDDNIGHIGLIPFLRCHEGKMKEDYIVGKMLQVKNILFKKGDAAIDAYLDITSPKPEPMVDMLREAGRQLDWDITDMCDELATEMTKDQFEHYLEIYNEFYGK